MTTNREIAEALLDEVIAEGVEPYVHDWSDTDVEVVHPDQMTGEGILAAIAANPEPPAWYEQQG